ncbi:MAG TPA: AAA family ATPase [Candidatus Paceibacterota bacterium]|nr:AAA family ATPase [Candidatus Paceibacterota bacterium]
MRIDIVGITGSGKSTLASRLSQKLGIPHIQLDTFWFEAGGRKGPYDTPNIDAVRAHVKTAVEKAVQQDSWISDGTYLHAQEVIAPAADVIIFLDTPLWTRLVAHARRTFFEPKRHKHLTVWDEISFFKEIITRTYRSRPKLITFLEGYIDKTIVLRSYKEIDEYVIGGAARK